MDLDAAFGRGSNAQLLTTVIDELDTEVELSGGVVDDASLAQALDTAATRVVIGTAALADLDWCARVVGQHGHRVAMGLDVRLTPSEDGSVHHQLAARGFTEAVGELWSVVRRLDQAGCARYIVTDVGQDGMLSGPNLELCCAVGEATGAAVIASGGVSDLQDLVHLAEAAASGANIEGAIVGKALYAERFTLPQALDAVATPSS